MRYFALLIILIFHFFQHLHHTSIINNIIVFLFKRISGWCLLATQRLHHRLILIIQFNLHRRIEFVKQLFAFSLYLLVCFNLNAMSLVKQLLSVQSTWFPLIQAQLNCLRLLLCHFTPFLFSELNLLLFHKWRMVSSYFLSLFAFGAFYRLHFIATFIFLCCRIVKTLNLGFFTLTALFALFI